MSTKFWKLKSIDKWKCTSRMEKAKSWSEEARKHVELMQRSIRKTQELESPGFPEGEGVDGARNRNSYKAV